MNSQIPSKTTTMPAPSPARHAMVPGQIGAREQQRHASNVRTMVMPRTMPARAAPCEQLVSGHAAVPIRDNVYAILSLSGGIGVSMVAAMTALRLAQRRHSCVLVDCDFTAGGLDVLLGLENEPGLRFQTVKAPLGHVDGPALNHELPRWERVGVLSSQPWSGEKPDSWEILAVLQALAESNDVVIVDMADGALYERVPELASYTQILIAELTVLGLARAKHAKTMLSRQGCAKPLIVGACPRGASPSKSIVSVEDAQEYLGDTLLGVITPDRHIQADVLEGLGVRAVSKGSRRAIDALVEYIEDDLGGDDDG
ncbi:septum site-determining protein minD, TadZ-like protein [Bifidobacterium goeldii]|nr:septum site-determining protein minD, TadZ-like protein [Bifidobacterium goeldii]